MSDWFDAEAHADRALEMYERGRWAEAEAELRKALSLNPDQPEYHFNLGLTLEAAGRDAESLASYERAVELMPGQIDPLLSAGIVANRIGQFEKALGFFLRVLKLDGRCEAAYANGMESHVRLGQHDDAETLFYMAQHALEEPSAQCLAMMGESLLQREQYERAGWCLKEALRLEPSLPRLRARLGAVYAQTGKPQKALQMYLRDLRDDPGNIDTLLDYGELLIEFGRLPDAAEKFRRVLELEPANVDAHCKLGEIAMQSGRFEQAHLEFELVLKLDPEFPGIRASLAEALLRRERLTEAQRWLREELGQFLAGENEAEAEIDLAHLGSLLLDARLHAEAAEVLERAVAADEENLDALRKLALARFNAGDRRGGIAASRRVLRRDRTCVRSMHNLALAALQEDRLQVAGAWIARGLAIDRHDDGLRRLRIRVWIAWLTSRLRRRR